MVLAAPPPMVAPGLLWRGVAAVADGSASALERWYSAAELAGLPGVPGTPQGLLLKARNEGWKSRPRKGRGGGKEYAFASLPPATQAALALRDAPAPQPGQTGGATALLTAARERYRLAPATHREMARQRLMALRAVEALCDQGTPLMRARTIVAAQLQRENVRAASVQSLCRWAADVAGLDRVDWIVALMPGYGIGLDESDRRQPIPAQVWDWYKGHYLTQARPSHASTYRHVARMAREQGWPIPSAKTFERRFQAEVPRTTTVILREGKEAARKLLPRQQRDELVFAAGEAVNGDGVKFDRLWVRFDDGEILNTATAWVWQDIRTRRILAWRFGKTESTDLFRLATYELTATCAPKHYWMDNTTVAANKTMTAGTKGRHRYHANDDDGLGLIPMIGGEAHFTSVDDRVRNPGAKPIERGFGTGGLHEEVATHPRIVAAGGYSKATAVSESLVREVLAEIVASHNARTKRRTRACNGLLSFDEAWQQGVAERPLRVLPESQRQLLLMAREVVTASRGSGHLLLQAGRRGLARNLYWSEALAELAGQRVVAHFDPDNLHAGVHVYGLDGQYLCFADYKPGAAFNSTDAAREHKKFLTRIDKARKKIAADETRMGALERAALYEAAVPPTEPAPVATPDVAGGNVVAGHFRRLPEPGRDAQRAAERATGTDGDVARAVKLDDYLKRIQEARDKDRI